MEALLLGLVSAAIGAAITIGVQRFQATWLKRRDTAAEAYGAAVAMHSAVLSALSLARRISAAIHARPHDLADIAQSSGWNLNGHIAASKARLDKLREARLNTRSIWGPDVAALFDDYFELTSAWHNALAVYHDDIDGVADPDEGVWDPDVTSFDWRSVRAGTSPHAEAFEREVEQLMDLIRRFARSADVAIMDQMELPPCVREVVTDYEDHRQRRLAVVRQAALPPPE